MHSFIRRENLRRYRNLLSSTSDEAVRSQLFGVSIAEPGIYGLGILLIVLVAAMAGFVPSRRAATVDPARALRTE